MLLTKDAILKAQDLVFEDVEVPEWGGTVRVRTLTGLERDQLESAIMSQGKTANMENLRARLVALTAVDDKGTRLFTLKDLEALGAKSSSALNKVFGVAQTLSGIGGDDVEALTKNSEGGQNENSTSD